MLAAFVASVEQLAEEFVRSAQTGETLVARVANATPLVLVQVMAPAETIAQSPERGTPTARPPAEPTRIKFCASARLDPPANAACTNAELAILVVLSPLGGVVVVVANCATASEGHRARRLTNRKDIAIP